MRSEISIRLIRTSAAVLLAEDAFLLRDLIRYVLAVEFESFGRRAKARGLEVPAGASQLRVPRNSSPMYLIMGLLVIHQYIPAIAIPEVAKLYSSYLMGTWGGDGLAPLILPKIYEWLLAIDQENEANPYGFVNRIFDGKLQEHQLKVLEVSCAHPSFSFVTGPRSSQPTISRRFMVEFALVTPGVPSWNSAVSWRRLLPKNLSTLRSRPSSHRLHAGETEAVYFQRDHSRTRISGFSQRHQPRAPSSSCWLRLLNKA